MGCPVLFGNSKVDCAFVQLRALQVVKSEEGGIESAVVLGCDCVSLVVRTEMQKGQGLDAMHPEDICWTSIEHGSSITRAT